MTFELDLAPDAEADIDDILEWSVTQFGTASATDTKHSSTWPSSASWTTPNRAGSHDRTDLGLGIRTLHLASSRDDVSQDVRRIANPRHFVVYRQVSSVIQVVRLLHEAMNLPEQRIP